MKKREITVVKEFVFDSAHFLLDYDGDCANIHGHTYKLHVGLRGEVNPATGMVMDFKQLKMIVNPLIKAMDHALLNQRHHFDLSFKATETACVPLKFVSDAYSSFPAMTTAENMTLWLRDMVSGLVAKEFGTDITVVLIRLWETPTSYAEWTE